MGVIVGKAKAEFRARTVVDDLVDETVLHLIEDDFVDESGVGVTVDGYSATLVFRTPQGEKIIIDIKSNV